MATLHEYFEKDFPDTLGWSSSWTLTPRASEMPVGTAPPPVEVVARTHMSESAFARFVSYFVPTDQAEAGWALRALVATPERVIEKADETVLATMSHPVYDPDGVNSNQVPFSGRVFLYVDAPVPEELRAELRDLARSQGRALQIRDHAYLKFRNDQESPLAFICHDSRDKEELTRPLAQQLQMMLCPVWYDEYSLKPGDSLREGIDRGLLACPKCVVVLSQAFLANPGWTKGEFNAIVSRHFSEGGSVLIPIWHAVSRNEVAAYSTLMADIVAINSNVGRDELARQVYRAVSG